MTIVVAPASVQESEFEGVGSSIDAAILDALNIASRQCEQSVKLDLEVIAWGIRSDGVGDTYAFWARVRDQSKQ